MRRAKESKDRRDAFGVFVRRALPGAMGRSPSSSCLAGPATNERMAPWDQEAGTWNSVSDRSALLLLLLLLRTLSINFSLTPISQ